LSGAEQVIRSGGFISQLEVILVGRLRRPRRQHPDPQTYTQIGDGLEMNAEEFRDPNPFGEEQARLAVEARLQVRSEREEVSARFSRLPGRRVRVNSRPPADVPVGSGREVGLESAVSESAVSESGEEETAVALLQVDPAVDGVSVGRDDSEVDCVTDEQMGHSGGFVSRLQPDPEVAPSVKADAAGDTVALSPEDEVEIGALCGLLFILRDLPTDAARRRVLRWGLDRYGADLGVVTQSLSGAIAAQ
jgi:hypothetical protein